MFYYTKKELELLERIEKSQTFKLAEDDKEFLKKYETRGVRLELDYLKAELTMRQFGIENTIAVFGSARNLPQDVAKKEVDRLIKQGVNGAELKKATKALSNSYFYEDARELGKIIGRIKKEKDNHLMVITGGGSGVMEAANRGAYEAGASSIGLNIKLPHKQHPNPYITPELYLQFQYFSIRKFHFFKRAKAMVVYPGGFGTIDELFELLTLIQTKTIKDIPIVFNSSISFFSAVLSTYVTKLCSPFTSISFSENFEASCLIKKPTPFARFTTCLVIMSSFIIRILII